MDMLEETRSLLDARVSDGVTMAHIARESGLPVQTLHALYYNPDRDPRWSTLSKLHSYLKSTRRRSG